MQNSFVLLEINSLFAGVPATSRCSIAGQLCGTNALCQNGLCCPMPTCPSGGQLECLKLYSLISGAPAAGPCAGSACPPGNECVNGQICCALPQCLRGEMASGRCVGEVSANVRETTQIHSYKGTQCAPGRTCQNGLCCNQPLCPNGQPGVQSCVGGGCPLGTECANGS